MMYLSFGMARRVPHGDHTGEIKETTGGFTDFQHDEIKVGLTGPSEEVEKLYSFLKKFYSIQM